MHDFRVRRFPYDKQECEMLFAFGELTSKELIINVIQPSERSDEISDQEWIAEVNFQKEQAKDSQSILTYSLSLSRNSASVLLHVLLPTFIISGIL